MARTTLLMTLVVLAFSSTSFAATSERTQKPSTPSFIFKFNYKGESLEVRRQTPTYEEAFRQAAQTCFEHYRRQIDGKMTEDQGLDVIDVCANPRS